MNKVCTFCWSRVVMLLFVSFSNLTFSSCLHLLDYLIFVFNLFDLHLFSFFFFLDTLVFFSLIFGFRCFARDFFAVLCFCISEHSIAWLPSRWRRSSRSSLFFRHCLKPFASCYFFHYFDIIFIRNALFYWVSSSSCTGSTRWYRHLNCPRPLVDLNVLHHYIQDALSFVHTHTHVYLFLLCLYAIIFENSFHSTFWWIVDHFFIPKSWVVLSSALVRPFHLDQLCQHSILVRLQFDSLLLSSHLFISFFAPSSFSSFSSSPSPLFLSLLPVLLLDLDSIALLARLTSWSACIRTPLAVRSASCSCSPWSSSISAFVFLCFWLLFDFRASQFRHHLPNLFDAASLLPGIGRFPAAALFCSPNSSSHINPGHVFCLSLFFVYVFVHFLIFLPTNHHLRPLSLLSSSSPAFLKQRQHPHY